MKYVEKEKKKNMEVRIVNVFTTPRNYALLRVIMRIFVLPATYELRVSSKSHLRDHPNGSPRVGHRMSKKTLTAKRAIEM